MKELRKFGIFILTGKGEERKLHEKEKNDEITKKGKK